MTAHAVGSPATLSASPNGAPNASAQASTAGFAHQLHAARQGVAPTARQHGTASQPAPERGAGGDRGKNPAALGTDARPSDGGADRAGKSRGPALAKDAAASTTPSSPQATAKPATPPVASTATPVLAEVVAAVAADDPAPGDKDADGSEQGAAALVGAMLALVGPAAGKVLPLGAAALPASSGKPVAADAGAAVLMQASDAASMVVATNLESAVMPAQLLAANGLSLSPKDVRDFTRTDAAPTLVLSAAPLAAPATPVSPPVLAPASAHAFAQELGQQVTWFVNQGIKQARIRLHPDELGALDLKISVNHGRVDVVFHAQHPGAVAAVQQSLPQLDQMLAQHGLSLGNTEVGQHDRGDPSGHAGRGDRVSELDEIHGASVATPLSQLGLLDAFA